MERKSPLYYRVQEEQATSGEEGEVDPYVLARELARDLIREYVRRGDTIHALMASQMGCGGPGYNAQIGGYMFQDFQLPTQRSIHLKSDQIGVEEVRGVSVMQVYSLREIYAEVQREDKGEEQVTQMSLFS